jgi:Ca2+-transporting ATPase
MFAFVSLGIGNLGLIFANRSCSLSIFESILIPNKVLWWVSGSALFSLTLVLNIPALRDVFQFNPLHRWELALLFIAGLSSILFAESGKLKPIYIMIYGKGKKSLIGRINSNTESNPKSQRLL